MRSTEVSHRSSTKSRAKAKRTSRRRIVKGDRRQRTKARSVTAT